MMMENNQACWLNPGEGTVSVSIVNFAKHNAAYSPTGFSEQWSLICLDSVATSKEQGACRTSKARVDLS